MHSLQPKLFSDRVNFLNKALKLPKLQIGRSAGATRSKLVITHDRALIAQRVEQRKTARCATWPTVEKKKRNISACADDSKPDWAAGHVEKPFTRLKG
jgi:hypothetical protein